MCSFIIFSGRYTLSTLLDDIAPRKQYAVLYEVYDLLYIFYGSGTITVSPIRISFIRLKPSESALDTPSGTLNGCSSVTRMNLTV